MAGRRFLIRAEVKLVDNQPRWSSTEKKYKWSVERKAKRLVHALLVLRSIVVCVSRARSGICVPLVKMAVVPVGKNKLKIGSAGRYYSAYLIYDVANSCLAALHAKMPPPVVVTRTNPPSPVHVQNPRKFSSLCFSISRPAGKKNALQPSQSILRSPLPRSFATKEAISRQTVTGEMGEDFSRIFVFYLSRPGKRQIIYYLNNTTWIVLYRYVSRRNTPPISLLSLRTAL